MLLLYNVWIRYVVAMTRYHCLLDLFLIAVLECQISWCKSVVYRRDDPDESLDPERGEGRTPQRTRIFGISLTSTKLLFSNSHLLRRVVAQQLCGSLEVFPMKRQMRYRLVDILPHPSAHDEYTLRQLCLLMRIVIIIAEIPLQSIMLPLVLQTIHTLALHPAFFLADYDVIILSV